MTLLQKDLFCSLLNMTASGEILSLDLLDCSKSCLQPFCLSRHTLTILGINPLTLGSTKGEDLKFNPKILFTYVKDFCLPM